MGPEETRGGEEKESPAATVLVVEDELDIVELYRETLETAGYEVRIARTAAAGAAALDEEVDAALLDRRLPDGTGRDVLEAWRAGDPEVPVAMVTAVEPDFDIVEFGFDLYVLKPLSGDRVVETVERLTARGGYSTTLRESAALAEKRAALRENWEEETLAENERYQTLLDRIDDLDAELERLEESFAPEDYRPTYRALGDGSDGGA